jgi:hypothetical protein
MAAWAIMGGATTLRKALEGCRGSVVIEGEAVVRVSEIRALNGRVKKMRNFMETRIKTIGN